MVAAVLVSHLGLTMPKEEEEVSLPGVLSAVGKFPRSPQQDWPWDFPEPITCWWDAGMMMTHFREEPLLTPQ